MNERFLKSHLKIFKIKLSDSYDVSVRLNDLLYRWYNEYFLIKKMNVGKDGTEKYINHIPCLDTWFVFDKSVTAAAAEIIYILSKVKG